MLSPELYIALGLDNLPPKVGTSRGGQLARFALKLFFFSIHFPYF